MGRLSLYISDTLSNLSIVFYHKALTALQRESKATSYDKMALNPHLLLVSCVHFEENMTGFRIKAQSHKKLCTDSIYRSL